MPEPVPEPGSEDAAILKDDPRPVFEGDWGKADGKARQAHLVRVNAWKRRHPELAGDARSAKGNGKGGEAQSRMGAGSEEPARSAHSRDDADLATLNAIIASKKSLPSDVIRAVAEAQRIAQRAEAEERQREHGPLIDLAKALEALPEEERVDALSTLLGVAPQVGVAPLPDAAAGSA